MIKNQVLKTKSDIVLTKEIFLAKGQEIEIVMDVIYINGYMIPPNLQNFFYDFIKKNPDQFIDTTMNW